MVYAQRRRTSNVLVPLSWQMLTGEKVTESDLKTALGQVSTKEALPALVALLQYADSRTAPAFEYLDRQVSRLYGNALGVRIANEMEKSDDLIFFSKWQLLLAIKLVCVFGARPAQPENLSNARLLRLLLMINHFIDDHPDRPSAPKTYEEQVSLIKTAILRGYSLIENEQPLALIGRYAELFKVLAHPDQKSTFKSWVDIAEVVKKQPRDSTTRVQSSSFLLVRKHFDRSAECRPSCITSTQKNTPSSMVR